MNIKILEKSLAGQQVVLKQSRDPVQIARVKKAIAKLENDILAIKGEWNDFESIRKITKKPSKINQL